MIPGYVFNAKLNLGQDLPMVTCKLNLNQISGYTLPSVPVLMPYGICNIPEDGTFSIYQSIGGENTSYVVTGGLNSNHDDKYSNLTDLKPGESATYNSSNFTTQLKLDGAYHVFTGATAQIKTKIINGENTNKILIDILAEIQSLETYINTFVATFMTHVHTGGNIANNTGPILAPGVPPPYVPTDNYMSDTEFLNTGIPNFIDKHGEKLS